MTDEVSSFTLQMAPKKSTGPIRLCYSRTPVYITGKQRKTLCYKLQVYLPQFYSFMFGQQHSHLKLTYMKYETVVNPFTAQLILKLKNGK